MSMFLVQFINEVFVFHFKKCPTIVLFQEYVFVFVFIFIVVVVVVGFLC